MTGCTVTWWGHACLGITLDGVRIVTDPLLRTRIGPLRFTGRLPSPGDVARTDLVLLSHLHRDHTDLPSLSRFPARTRLLVPQGAGALVRQRVRGGVREVAPGAAVTVGPVTVQATYAAHDGRRGFGGPAGIAVGYLLRGSVTVYFAGDTELFAGMADLPPLDVALLPVGGWGRTLGAGHLDPTRAAEALTLLRAGTAVPIHWGTLHLPGLRPLGGASAGDQLVRAAAGTAPGTRVVPLQPGRPFVVPQVVAG